MGLNPGSPTNFDAVTAIFKRFMERSLSTPVAMGARMAPNFGK